MSTKHSNPGPNPKNGAHGEVAMREEVSSLVHSVFARGLSLRERVLHGETPDLESEQAGLRRLLEGPPEARRWPEFVGDEERLQDDGRAGPPFLGVRYALACWLDELFILHSPWDSAWNERKIEAALYGTNDRAWRFWEQAQVVEQRGEDRLLQIFYMCVMLGFRGDMTDTPERLETWSADVRGRLLSGGAQEWSAPPQLEPPTSVPPLRGRDEMRRMALAAGVILLMALPLLAFLVVRHLAS